MNDTEFRQALDYRGYDEEVDISQWRILLRRTLYGQRFVSDLSRRSAASGYDLHEGLFTRADVPKSSWQNLLFSGVNCFLLLREEHDPFPPDRKTCYWLAVANYSKGLVDSWIESLPFKVRPATPWKDSHGAEVLTRIPDRYRVNRDWDAWFQSILHKVNMEG